MRHFLSVLDLSAAEIAEVFDLAIELKTKLAQGIREPILPGRVLALIFDKPSLRTRVSFETAIAHLGGNSIFLGQDTGWGKGREPICDFAQVLSSYVDVIACRTTAHVRIEELAKYSTCPVINGLTDFSHPCQALADLLTLQETFGPLAGKKLAFVGDANNVARSLAEACGRMGMEFAIAAPPGYQFDGAFLLEMKRDLPTLKFTQSDKPAEIVSGACCVYTDVWTSMGQEAEKESRLKSFTGFQVNSALMKQAPADAKFLHCLPAHRGEEVSAEVIDGPQSLVIPQAENRMHLQKALMAWLLK